MVSDTPGAKSDWAEQSDPLFALLKRLRVASPARFAMVYTGLWLLSHVTFLTIVRVTQPDGASVAVAGTLAPSNVIYSVVIVPMLAGFYCWIGRESQGLFHKLRHADIWRIPGDQEVVVKELDSVAGWVARLLSYRWLYVPAVVVPVLGLSAEGLSVFAYGQSYLSPVKDAPSSVYHVGFACFALTVLVGWYFAVLIIVRCVAVVFGLRWLFRGRRLKLHPLHPDRCGGLGMINRYALGVTYFVALAGLGLVLTAWNLARTGHLQSNPIYTAGIVGYLALTPLLFFATLGAAHSQMLEAKESFLKKIADQFLNDFEQAQNVLAGSNEDLKLKMQKIEQIQALYDLARAFPVWPFDATSLRRFSGAFLSPALPVLLSALVQYFLKWLD